MPVRLQDVFPSCFLYHYALTSLALTLSSPLPRRACRVWACCGRVVGVFGLFLPAPTLRHTFPAHSASPHPKLISSTPCPVCCTSLVWVAEAGDSFDRYGRPGGQRGGECTPSSPCHTATGVPRHSRSRHWHATSTATAITWSRPLLKQRGPLHHPGTWWRKQQRQHWPPARSWLSGGRCVHPAQVHADKTGRASAVLPAAWPQAASRYPPGCCTRGDGWQWPLCPHCYPRSCWC